VYYVSLWRLDAREKMVYDHDDSEGPAVPRMLFAFPHNTVVLCRFRQKNPIVARLDFRSDTDGGDWGRESVAEAQSCESKLDVMLNQNCCG